MTLPARSLPDASEPDSPEPDVSGPDVSGPDVSGPDSSPPALLTPERDLPFPLRFLAVVGISTLVIILCGLGAVFSSGFGLFGGDTGPHPSATAPSPTYDIVVADPAAQFLDGQWTVGLDVTAGTYETTVPADSSGCAWEHAIPGKTVNSIMSTGTAAAGQTLLVRLAKPGEVISSEGCGTWHRSGD